MGVVLDTSFVIDLLRGQKRASALALALDEEGAQVFLPAPVLYEVRAGLHATARAQAARFTAMLRSFPVLVLVLDAAAAERAAEIQADALAAGSARGEWDALIAGIALEGGHTLVTRDEGYADLADAFGLRLRTY